MFDGFGPEKLVVILLIVLVLFGGRRIPEIGSSLGKGIREFKKGIREVTDTVNEPEATPSRPMASLPGAPVNTGTATYEDGRGAPKRLIDN